MNFLFKKTSGLLVILDRNKELGKGELGFGWNQINGFLRSGVSESLDCGVRNGKRKETWVHEWVCLIDS